MFGSVASSDYQSNTSFRIYLTNMGETWFKLVYYPPSEARGAISNLYRDLTYTFHLKMIIIII